MNKIKKDINYYLNTPYFFICIIALLAGFIFFTKYDKPQGLFWDENYHIASAQKYINGVFFLEPHPPLGKMLIALGEIVLNPNKNLDLSYCSTTDYIKEVPEGYKFNGVRFASTFFAFLSSILFFLILYNLIQNSYIACLFTFLYIFDNAIVVHSRAAMLEGIQLFFIFASILFFSYIIRIKKVFKTLDYFILGVLISLATMVKVNSLILLLLPIFLIFIEYSKYILKLQLKKDFLIQLFLKFISFSIGFFLIVFLVFYAHFNIAKRVINDRYYEVSKEMKYIIDKRQTSNPANFFLMLNEYLKYIHRYEKGVPKLDPCKPGENGSHPLNWPIGKKAINYRWSKNDDKVSYVYLQCNPLIWFAGLTGILLSLVLIISRYVFALQIKNKNIFYKILCFTLLYLGYMIAMLKIERVMYLYHYFIPLTFSLICFYLLFFYLFEEQIKRENVIVIFSILLFFIFVVLTFFFYSPFTYYIPLTYKQFMLRVWFKFWGLEPVL